jgi:hypothetical protein
MKRIFCNLPRLLTAALDGASALRALGQEAKFRKALRTSVRLGAFALAGVLAGCGAKESASKEAQTESVQVPQFSAKKGLLLPDETRRSLNLKLVEVTEQKVSATLDLQLRVYQVAGATGLASGMIMPEEAKQLKVGQAVQIRTGESNAVPAKVFKISDPFEKAAGLIEVIVEIQNRSDSIAVGGFLQASVTLDSAEKVVSIPRVALLECSEGSFVYTVSGDCLVRTAVKVGTINHEFVEIKDGLYSGDQVALQPVISLWLTELAAVKGGQACCVEPPKGR